MQTLEQVRQWVEAGKQIGKVFSFNRNGETCWSSVAIQKWNGVYKVYIDEVLESKMSADDYEKEIIESFRELDDAIYFIESSTSIVFSDLTPCKGQKIFNPNFN